MTKVKFAPRNIFEQILEWSVIPTFDLVIDVEGQGVIIVHRKIAPYQNQWALPGLRMLKGESIDDTLARIADKELGLPIIPSQGKLLSQYVGNFTTEHHRQDISTAYYFRVPSTSQLSVNHDHFSSSRIIESRDEIPSRMGAMYKHHLNRYFDLKHR